MVRGINHAAGFHTPHPHDAISMTSSYISVDANSVASGSVAPDSFPSPDADSLRSFSTLGSQAGELLNVLCITNTRLVFVLTLTEGVRARVGQPSFSNLADFPSNMF